MTYIFGLHEYELRKDIAPQAFERRLKRALQDPALNMLGLVFRHLLRGYKGERKGKYAALWVFRSRRALERLFGTEKQPRRGPLAFIHFEDVILTPLLDRPAHLITFTDYEELLRVPAHRLRKLGLRKVSSRRSRRAK